MPGFLISGSVWATVGLCIAESWNIPSHLEFMEFMLRSFGQTCGGGSVLLFSMSPLYIFRSHFKCPRSVHLTGRLAVKYPKNAYLTGRLAVKWPWNTHLTSPPGVKCPKNVNLTRRLAVKYRKNAHLTGRLAVKGQWNTHLTSPPAVKCLRNVNLTGRLAVKYEKKYAFNRPDGG